MLSFVVNRELDNNVSSYYLYYNVLSVNNVVQLDSIGITSVMRESRRILCPWYVAYKGAPAFDIDNFTRMCNIVMLVFIGFNIHHGANRRRCSSMFLLLRVLLR